MKARFINEGLFSISLEERIARCNKKIAQFNSLLRDAVYYSNEDAFITYIDYCEEILEDLIKLSKKERTNHLDNFIRISLDAINNTWPKKIKASSASEEFIEQLRNIISMHSKLAEIFDTNTMQVSKFKIL